jgi:hypothetical protein
MSCLSKAAHETWPNVMRLPLSANPFRLGANDNRKLVFLDFGGAHRTPRRETLPTQTRRVPGQRNISAQFAASIHSSHNISSLHSFLGPVQPDKAEEMGKLGRPLNQAALAYCREPQVYLPDNSRKSRVQRAQLAISWVMHRIHKRQGQKRERVSPRAVFR